jgi:GDP-4-dehydro-6-deoxy-D-mannose reductase
VSADSSRVDVTCDLVNRGATTAVIRNFLPDVMLHMAGATAGLDLVELLRVNVESLDSVLSAIQEHAPSCRVVVPGSAAEYGECDAADGLIAEDRELRPVSPYAISKARQIGLALDYARRGAPVVVGRVFNLSGFGVPPTFVLGAVAQQLREIAAGRAEPVLRVGDLSAIRDFIDVDDACGALLALALEGRPGQVYNVCSGQATTIGDVVERLVELSGTGASVVSSAPSRDRGNVSWSVGSNAKILAETGWQPEVSQTQSLERMLSQKG